MLIMEGTERTITIDMRLAAVLSLVAGAINSAGFHALGFFSANMTGNASMLSDLLAVGEFAAAAGFLTIMLAFVFGAYTSTEMIEFGRRRAIKSIYAYVIGIEAIALVMLGCVVILTGTANVAPLLLTGLSFLMGLQNAATTRISNSRVRTTHISGIATDIGIGLAALRRTAADKREALNSMIRLQLLTVVSFITGGVIGVLLYESVEGYLLIVAGSALAIASITEARRGRRI